MVFKGFSGPIEFTTKPRNFPYITDLSSKVKYYLGHPYGRPIGDPI